MVVEQRKAVAVWKSFTFGCLCSMNNPSYGGIITL